MSPVLLRCPLCNGEAFVDADGCSESRSLDWQRAKALTGKALAQARGEAFQATRAKYGFTSASISAYGTACTIATAPFGMAEK